jgi:hypothetical protein
MRINDISWHSGILALSFWRFFQVGSFCVGKTFQSFKITDGFSAREMTVDAAIHGVSGAFDINSGRKRSTGISYPDPF